MAWRVLKHILLLEFCYHNSVNMFVQQWHHSCDGTLLFCGKPLVKQLASAAGADLANAIFC